MLSKRFRLCEAESTRVTLVEQPTHDTENILMPLETPSVQVPQDAELLQAGEMMLDIYPQRREEMVICPAQSVDFLTALAFYRLIYVMFGIAPARPLVSLVQTDRHLPGDVKHDAGCAQHGLVMETTG